MQKRRFCAISLFLCMALLFSMSAYAAETRASSYIINKGVTIGVKSDGDLSIYFFVRSNGTMDTLGASKVVVERYNGSRWVPEYTFTPSNESKLQTSGTSYYNTTLTYTPDYEDTDYQVVVTFYAKDADGSDSKTVTSKTVTT